MYISTVTDEVTPDRSATAMPRVFAKLGTYGIRDIEIRSVETKRFPTVDSAAYERLRSCAAEHEVTISAVSPGIYKSKLGSALMRIHRSAILDASLELGEDLGTRTLIVFGVERSEDDGPTAQQQAIEILGETADQAATRGFDVQLENLPGTWADTGENCLALLEGVGRENFGYVWDTGNLYEAEQRDFRESYDLLRPFIRNVHLKDGRFIDGVMTWQRFGEGVTDIAGQIEALKADGYAGKLSVEAKCEPHLEEDFDVSVQYLQSLL